MLGETGNGQRPRDRSQSDDQLVVGQLDRLAVDPLDHEPPPGGVCAADAADHEFGPPQLRAKRDRNVTGIECPAGRAREQWRVEQEVGVVDQRHPGALGGKQPLQCAGCVEPTESAARDHHLPSHEDTIGCVR